MAAQEAVDKMRKTTASRRARSVAAPGLLGMASTATGLSNAEIAQALVVSNATVKTHVSRIFYKTRSRDRAQAVRYAHRPGIATETLFLPGWPRATR